MKVDCNFQDKLYPPSELHALMKESDYVVAALPYTPTTDKLISEEAIKCMKPSSVFINVGRGKTVDEDALIKGEIQIMLGFKVILGA